MNSPLQSTPLHINTLLDLILPPTEEFGKILFFESLQLPCHLSLDFF